METTSELHAPAIPRPPLYSQLPESMRQTLMIRNQRSAGFIDGPLLDAADWTSSVFNTPPSKHRLFCAMGLTLSLILGGEAMRVLTGMNLAGAPLAKRDVTPILRPLHGVLKYEPHAVDMKNRWMKIIHFGGVSAAGAMGAYFASKLFFQKREDSLRHPKYLDEYEESATFEQGKPWGILAAITAVPGASAGFTHIGTILPFANYGITLGNRFMLSNGFKLATPGLGKALNNSHSTYKFGPSKLIDYMISYLCENRDEVPVQLPAITRGILGPWFGDVPEQTIDAFMQEAMKIREKHFRKGGMLPEQQEACRKELNARFHKKGLEDTLIKIGLNPHDATVANNGVIGKFSELFEKGSVKLRKDFALGYDKRHSELPDEVKAIALPEPLGKEPLSTKDAIGQLATEPKPLKQRAMSPSDYMTKALTSKQQALSVAM